MKISWMVLDFSFIIRVSRVAFEETSVTFRVVFGEVRNVMDRDRVNMRELTLINAM